MEQVVVAGVTYNKNEAKITVSEVPDRPGTASKIFAPLAERHRCRYDRPEREPRGLHGHDVHDGEGGRQKAYKLME